MEEKEGDKSRECEGEVSERKRLEDPMYEAFAPVVVGC